MPRRKSRGQNDKARVKAAPKTITPAMRVSGKPVKDTPPTFGWWSKQFLLASSGITLTAIWGRKLNDILSPRVLFAVMLVCLYAFLGVWTWTLSARVTNWRPFGMTARRWIAVGLIAVLGALFAPS